MEPLGLGGDLGTGRGGLGGIGGIRLRHRIHLVDGEAKLPDAVGLLGIGCCDTGDQRGSGLGTLGDLVERAGHVLDDGHAIAGAGLHMIDEIGRVAGRLCGPFREAANLLRDHGESLARYSGTGGLHGGVEREQVGLKGDFGDRFDDESCFVGRRLDGFHRRQHACHRRLAVGGECHGRDAAGIGMPGIGGVLPRHVGDQADRTGRLLERGGLLLGA